MLEALFLGLAGLYLFYRASEITTFSLPWPSGFDNTLLMVIAVVAVLRLLSTPFKRKETLVALGMTATCILVYRTGGYRFLLYLAALTVGFIDIDYRKILRVYLLAVGAVYCAAVLAGLIAAIPVFIRIKDGLRSSWGICYPTDFATIGLFLSLMLWVYWTRLPDWAMLFICAGSTALSWFIAHSYTSTLCGLLFFTAILYHMFERGVVTRYPKQKRIEKAADWFVLLAFFACALAIFTLMALYAYKTDIGYKVNNRMSNRLQFMVNAWQEYGSKPFGSKFSQRGNGFSNFAPLNYAFVDSTYPLVLIRYGWVLFTVICLFWVWTVRKVIRCGDRRLLLVMGIIAVHSFSEHHYIECHYNILVAMALATFPERSLSPNGEEKPALLGKAWLNRYGEGLSPSAIVITALSVGGVCLAGPAMLSRLKTTLELRDLCGGGERGWALFGIMLGVIGALFSALWGLNEVIKAVIAKSRSRAFVGPAAALLAGVIALGSAFLYSGGVLRDAMAEKSAIPRADRKALEIAVAASGNGVYSGILPSLYVQGVEGMRYAAFFGDDLSRLRGSTALMDADEEHNAFFDSGCLYVQVSDTHAIYTSDREVIEALTAVGYHLTGYYSTEKEVDLKAAAATYDLKYSEGKGLLLNGTKRVLKRSPYMNLYAGKYTATFELRLPKKASAEDGVVCTLSVTTYKGKNVLLEKEILRNQFDEDGKLTVSIPFTIADSRDVAFRARTEKGRKVYVRRISYVRTPDYDLHALYDNRLRKVREEYHTLEGAAIEGPGGYFAVEYGYDDRKNVNLIRYYNRDDEPTLHTSGYAEVRRAFNANRQIIREEYYGTDGQPIALTSRQASIEREYDSNGNITVIRYYDIDGNPVITTSGYAEIHRTFDENHKIVSEEYFGIDGQPMPLSTGQYNIGQEYDDAGNVIVKRYYGEDGKLQSRSEGYTEIRMQYNGMHQIVREEFYDAEGQPVMITNGYAADEREYDDAGNVTAYRYFNTDGQPTIIKSGYAELRRSYNSQRKVVREEYYDVDGQPLFLTAGYFAFENEYDEAGNVIVRRFFNPDGELILRAEGYAEVHWQYNEMRKVLREEFYGTDGNPVCINTGQAANEREYDDAGNATVYRFFDVLGNPVVTTYGYAEIHKTYNEQRQIVHEDYFDTNGAPMVQPEGHCAVEQAFDGMGNISVKRYFDGDGEPVVICDGYAEIHRTFNNRKQVIREEYYGVDGSPMVRAAGHSAIEQEYDDKGLLAVRRYLDAQGNPMQRVDGYAEARWTQDAKSDVRNVSFFDLKGEEIPIDGLNLVMDLSDGWSKWYIPQTGMLNACINIASTYLGEKTPGDIYSCQIEIEFRDVASISGQSFEFFTQGATDDTWKVRNIWNKSLLGLEEAPENGVYRFTNSQILDEKMATVSKNTIGFRCDYWASGSFRVRNIKVEKGDTVSTWGPGL